MYELDIEGFTISGVIDIMTALQRLDLPARFYAWEDYATSNF